MTTPNPPTPLRKIAEETMRKMPPLYSGSLDERGSKETYFACVTAVESALRGVVEEATESISIMSCGCAQRILKHFHITPPPDGGEEHK